MLKGLLDLADLRSVRGWAQDDAEPETPVSVLILDHDALVCRVLANSYRADLERAGIGSGRHAFAVDFPTPLSSAERHVIRACRESDGAELEQSPVVIEPLEVFNAAAERAVAAILTRFGAEEGITRKIGFLAAQLDSLRGQLGDRDSRRRERSTYRELHQRGARHSPAPGAAGPGADMPPASMLRALVIDDRVPKPDQDAGSTVILSHMRSLQRLGYEVTFVPAVEAPANDDLAVLDEIAVECCRSPYYGSVEEVLRRQEGEFALVYLHRIANAAKYGELARHYFPKARQVYSVADLHHIRTARQAAAEDRPELRGRAERLRLAEFVAAALADAVITHSNYEAEILRRHVPGAKIHTVRWSVTPRPPRVPVARRNGIAFIGGYGHSPNLDAARWLIDEIMPIVRSQDPTIECLLVGSNLPKQLRRLCGNGVVAVGFLPRLRSIFDRVRLTVAPLGYGAGVKGKVIESLAAGVPCVCTPIGAEGLELPEALRVCIADDAPAIAAAILRLHDDAVANEACGRAGLDYIASAFSEAQLDTAMRQAVAYNSCR